MPSRQFLALIAVGVGVCIGVALRDYFFLEPKVGAQEVAAVPDLAAQLEALKGKLPDQAHAMQDVGYHFSNLWFAGQHDNWELAQFYWNEVRSHLHWAVRIIPVRKDNAGSDVKLADILTAFENGPLKQLNDTIASKDREQFEKAYRVTMEGCYACHKASDKSFIRPQIPSVPETPIINFDPAATWPR